MFIVNFIISLFIEFCQCSLQVRLLTLGVNELALLLSRPLRGARIETLLIL